MKRGRKERVKEMNLDKEKEEEVNNIPMNVKEDGEGGRRSDGLERGT